MAELLMAQDCFAPIRAMMEGAGDHVVADGATTLRYLNPFEGVVLTVGDHRQGGQTHFQMTGQGVITVLFSLLGQSVIIDQYGMEWEIPANSFGILYRPKGEPYEVHVSEAGDVLTLGLHIAPEVLARPPFKQAFDYLHDEIAMALNSEGCLIARIGMTTLLRRQVLSTALCWRDPSALRALEAAIRTIELIDGIASIAETDGADIHWLRPSHTLVENIIAAKEMIETGFARNLTLTDLARRAAMSETRFKRNFKALLGTSPLAYLLQVRIDRAKDMLRTTDASIGQISWAVGYTHQCNFTVAFKRCTGQSPKEYRSLSHALH